MAWAKGFSFRQSGGFTLLETLAALTIACLLVALLYPFVSRMVAESHQAACVANLKNLATASQQFFADNNGEFFSRSYTTDLKPYLGRRDNWWQPTLFKKSDVSCPAINPMRGAKFNSGIYGVNYIFINEIIDYNTGQPALTWPLRMVNVAKPSKAWLFSEAGRCLADGSAAVDPLSYLTPGSLATEPKPGVASLIWPHREKRKNFSFLDGHVESLSWSEVQKPSNTPAYKEFYGLRE